MKAMDDVLPGEDLIEAGLQDLRDGRETIAALLVAIGSPRLRRLGLELPEHLPANLFQTGRGTLIASDRYHTSAQPDRL